MPSFPLVNLARTNIFIPEGIKNAGIANLINVYFVSDAWILMIRNDMCYAALNCDQRFKFSDHFFLIPALCFSVGFSRSLSWLQTFCVDVVNTNIFAHCSSVICGSPNPTISYRRLSRLMFTCRFLYLYQCKRLPKILCNIKCTDLFLPYLLHDPTI